MSEGTIPVPKALVEAILKYFWSRPMSEVYDLFTQLSAVVHGATSKGDPQAPPNPMATTGGQLLHRDQLMNQ